MKTANEILRSYIQDIHERITFIADNMLFINYWAFEQKQGMANAIEFLIENKEREVQEHYSNLRRADMIADSCWLGHTF
jgi:hypothetical protein